MVILFSLSAECTDITNINSNIGIQNDRNPPVCIHYQIGLEMFAFITAPRDGILPQLTRGYIAIRKVDDS
jgi:hypothetical protein